MVPLRLQVGATLGNYELGRPIGSGGMGCVYEAIHRTLRRRVALKVLFAQSVDARQMELATARFLREGRVAALVRHPHVVDVFDFGVEDGLPFLVMELVDGMTLAQLLKRESRLTLEKTIEIMLPVVSAVAELHAAGIVHRDLKPANILLARGRGNEICPKVADFGVSRLDDGSDRVTQSGVTIGTLEYMSPEQIRGGKDVTDRCDQYALGVVLYECLTGRRPFEGASDFDLTRAIVAGERVPPSRLIPEIAPELDAVVLRAMAGDPQQRFPCVDHLGAALLAFAPTAIAARWRSEFALADTRKRQLAMALREFAPQPAHGHVDLVLGTMSEARSSSVSPAPSARVDPLAATVPSGTRAWWSGTTGSRRSRKAMGAVAAGLVLAAGGAGLATRVFTSAPPRPSASPSRAAASTAAAEPPAPPPVAPEPLASAVTPLVASTRSPPPPATEATPHRGAPPPTARPAVPPPSAKASCDPPYFIDSEGDRKYKKECL